MLHHTNGFGHLKKVNPPCEIFLATNSEILHFCNIIIIHINPSWQNPSSCSA